MCVCVCVREREREKERERERETYSGFPSPDLSVSGFSGPSFLKEVKTLTSVPQFSPQGPPEPPRRPGM